LQSAERKTNYFGSLSGWFPEQQALEFELGVPLPTRVRETFAHTPISRHDSEIFLEQAPGKKLLAFGRPGKKGGSSFRAVESNLAGLQAKNTAARRRATIARPIEAGLFSKRPLCHPSFVPRINQQGEIGDHPAMNFGFSKKFSARDSRRLIRQKIGSRGTKADSLARLTMAIGRSHER